MRNKNMFHTRMIAVTAIAALVVSISGCGDKKQVQNVQSYRQIGLNQLDQGDYESAIHAFDKALNERVGIVSNLEVDINFYKAYAQIEAGKTQDAIDTYTALVEYDDKNADAYYLRGCAYISTQEAELAAKDFEQAVKYKKDSGELYANIYEQLTSAGLLDEAAVYLEQGLKIKGDDAAACVSRGRLYLASGSYAQAEEELEKALEQIEEENKKNKKKNTSEGMAVNLYLGEAVRAQGRDDEAAEYFQEYATEHPNDTKVLYELGELAFEEGAYQQALTYFEQGLSCENIINRRELWTGKIAALEYSGDFDTAKQEMKNYLKSYPNDAQAQREYIFLKTR